MISHSPLPSWKQLFGKNEKNTETVYPDSAYLYAESWISLHQVLCAYRVCHQKELVICWVPDYFCFETLGKLEEDWLVFIYYPVNQKLEPEWGIIKGAFEKEKPDFFLFAHYFGIRCDVERARQFCDKAGCLLIEDCAHVLYPHEKIGVRGDFVIYSPHKSLGIPDGAVLCINEIKGTDKKELTEQIKSQYDALSRRRKTLLWRVKRGIQMAAHISGKIPYTVGIHFGTPVGKKYPQERISQYAEKLLRSYSQIMFAEIAYKKRLNLDMYRFLLKEKYPELIAVTDERIECPYYAVFSMENVSDKGRLLEDLLQKGYLARSWPDLPLDLKKEPTLHQTAFHLSQNIFCLPVHAQAAPQELLKKYGDFQKRENAGLFQIVWDEASEEQWTELLGRVEMSNMLQDWFYGTVKQQTEGWRVHRGIVYHKEEEVGLVQILVKRFCGISLAVRVNRGPLLIAGYDSPENKRMILEKIRVRFGRHCLFLFAPAMEYSPENLSLLTASRYKMWDYFGFSSDVIDLQKTEAELRAGLKSQWRNQLTAAEKNGLQVSFQWENPEELLSRYAESKREKNFTGTPENVLRELLKNEKKVKVLCAVTSEGELAAFDIFYLHGRMATYLVGWSNAAGRKLYANNLLLFQGMLWMKNLGMEQFDLGGVDDIHTGAIARFKKGMNGTAYRLIGECRKWLV